MAEDFSDKNKDYGLPKVEPQPIDRGQPGIAKEVVKKEQHPKKKDNKLMLIVLSVVGVLVLASLLYLLIGDNDSSLPSTPGPVAEVKDQALVDQEQQQNSEEAITVEQAGSDGSTDRVEGAIVLSEEPGSITTISQRTNRYYIFLGSYKFQAYAQRHAEKLAADGFSVKLITPDNWVGVRVAVGNYAEKNEAGTDAHQLRSKYGNEVVISKY